jgi:hypothetical protein
VGPRARAPAALPRPPDARESDAPGQLVEYFRAADEIEEVSASPEDAEVVDVPEQSRYELRVGGRTIGVAAYRRRKGRIAFTHTEVDEPYEGRGFGAGSPSPCSTTRVARNSTSFLSARSSRTTIEEHPSTRSSSLPGTVTAERGQPRSGGSA